MKYKIFRRNSIYYFRMRIPKRFRNITLKIEHVVTLRTSDGLRARELAVIEERRLLNGLERGVYVGKSIDEKALIAARLNNLPELSKEELAKLSATEKVADAFARFEFSKNSDKRQHSKAEKAALVGHIVKSMHLDEVFERYKFLVSWDQKYPSKADQKKASAPILESIKRFIETTGCSNLYKLGPEHVRTYRDWLLTEVQNNRIASRTANKKLTHLRKIVAKVLTKDNLKHPNPFVCINIDNVGNPGKRNPFRTEEIKPLIEHIEQSDYKDQIKALNIVAIFTGAAPKELCLLEEADIVLDDVVPHIKIRPNQFRNKVKNGGPRHRNIPLVGPALLWMKTFPEGFDQYRRDGGADALSAISAKMIKAKFIGRTYYSYRHHFADCLRSNRSDSALISQIMGHKIQNMTGHYGAGYSLELIKENIEAAFKGFF